MTNVRFKDLNNYELVQINGGAVLGVLLGAANGWSMGLACAFVGSCVTPNWTWQDTKNMMRAGAIAGAYIGGFLPV